MVTSSSGEIRRNNWENCLKGNEIILSKHRKGPLQAVLRQKIEERRQFAKTWTGWDADFQVSARLGLQRTCSGKRLPCRMCGSRNPLNVLSMCQQCWQRIVRFPAQPVTEVHTRPPTRAEELSQLYFVDSEYVRFREEAAAE